MNVVGLILTFFFGAASIYLYLKSRRFKQIVFTGLFSTLQIRNHPDISISFKGTDIKNLSKFLVVCWNGGTEEIRAVDIPSGECPSIKFSENNRVLSYKVLAQSSPGLNFEVQEIDGRTLNFKFEYLNPKDGGLIEILYEKLVDEDTTIDLKAEIIGGRKAVERIYARMNRWLVIAALAIAGIGVIVTGSMGLRFLIAGSLADLKGKAHLIGGSLESLLTIVCLYVVIQVTRIGLSRQAPDFAVKFFEGKS
jgi:hypothetical protein